MAQCPDGISQGPIWGPILFNVFISDVDSGIACTISKSEDDTKLSDTVDTPERQDAIQRDVDKLEKWTHMKFMMFNKAKCKALYLGWGNPQDQHRMGVEGIETSPVEEDLEVLVGEKLDMSRQRVLTAQAANRILGCIGRNVCSRLSARILPFCSILTRPRWESCIQLWRPQHKQDMELLERVQRRATKMITGMEHLSLEERLRGWRLFSLEKRRL